MKILKPIKWHWTFASLQKFLDLLWLGVDSVWLVLFWLLPNFRLSSKPSTLLLSCNSYTIQILLPTSSSTCCLLLIFLSYTPTLFHAKGLGGMRLPMDISMFLKKCQGVTQLTRQLGCRYGCLSVNCEWGWMDGWWMDESMNQWMSPSSLKFPGV